MTEAADVTAIEDGVHDMPAEEYHRDPLRHAGGSLSSTGARKLLACPAKFRYEQDNPPAPKQHLELGTAAHTLVLGDGPEFAVLDYPDYNTKAAQAERDQARAEGLLPLLAREHQQVKDMAAAIRQHPLAAALFSPVTGKPEQTLIWHDRRTGAGRRARFDWLRHPGDGRLLIPDYKTTRDASPAAVQKSIYTFGYHIQADWYEDGALTLGLADETAFLLVFQEKEPPYLVSVVEPDPVAMRIAAARNRQAIDRWIDCTRTGRWPGYGDDIHHLPLPIWAEKRELDDLEECL